MSDDMETNELISVAMQIILHAGDARVKTENALEQAKAFEFEKAKELIIEAKECIRLAHQSQTEVIQNETRGKTYEPSLLFNHAQDTLMTIMSEHKLAKEIIDLIEIVNQKINNK
ncbi:MAG: PTS lactose/cellobiose transporter subunit IIA [Coprobacillaceae bacterium]